jgi:hypothetical protein
MLSPWPKGDNMWDVLAKHSRSYFQKSAYYYIE